MWIPKKHGIARVNIGVAESLVKCPSCETDQWADIMISSVYVHIYFVPFYPDDKDAFVCCKNCGLKRYRVPFNAKFIGNYEDIKRLYRHPWYTYVGILILSAPFILLLFVLIYNGFNGKM